MDVGVTNQPGGIFPTDGCNTESIAPNRAWNGVIMSGNSFIVVSGRLGEKLG